MKIHHLFQPHFRLIYLFIWGLIISGLSDLTWLIPLNVLAVSLFFISLLFSQKSFLPYLKRWFALIIFIALMWVTLSWKIGENGIELNFQGIELAEKLSLRTHLLLISLWLFLWNINDAVLVQAIGKLPLPEKLIQLFGPTVLDDVAFGPLNQNVPREQAYHIAEQQLERLSITGLKDRMVHTLSGGEKNFTALAGVLAMQPKILLLDEPTNGLDRKNTEKLTALLRELSLPILISSHHHGFINELATEIIRFTNK